MACVTSVLALSHHSYPHRLTSAKKPAAVVTGGLLKLSSSTTNTHTHTHADTAAPGSGGAQARDYHQREQMMSELHSRLGGGGGGGGRGTYDTKSNDGGSSGGGSPRSASSAR